jgi:UDP-N-acetylmuramate--alanine ligase
MNLLKYQKFYLIGIKGVGMTMLAQFLKHQGKDVSGSDIADVFMTDSVLKGAKINFSSGFVSSNLPKDAVIIYSSAYTSENNDEVATAMKRIKITKIPVLNYAQAMGALFNIYKGIAVCGSHGKTTTTAWLGFIWQKLGLSPSILVGARVPQLKGSAVLGSSNYFIAEADEYQNKLQYFQPYGVVLNNIEFDHPDYFKSKQAYYQVFADFVKKIPKNGFLVANAQDEQVKKTIKLSAGKVFSYAISDEMEIKKASQQVCLLAHAISRQGVYQVFKVNDFGEFKIRLFGRHNIENALAVIASVLALGISPEMIKKPLSQFTGTARRSELMGIYRGALIYDDYGHHPTEVLKTIKAFKEFYEHKRLIVLFHPHTFTRTKALFKDFVSSFDQADSLGILSIYGSAREAQGGVSSQELVTAINERNDGGVKNRKNKKDKNSKKEAVCLKDFDEALKWLKKETRKDDIVLLLGAGDVFRVGERLLKK